jgi:hypothetical protein
METPEMVNLWRYHRGEWTRLSKQVVGADPDADTVVKLGFEDRVAFGMGSEDGLCVAFRLWAGGDLRGRPEPVLAEVGLCERVQLVWLDDIGDFARFVREWGQTLDVLCRMMVDREVRR